ncbi:MAG: copper homeostasis protein CutC [Tissierellia bacterium]|nr:copper homeostasis protein CutC [Tissierellia bacterium]
MIVELCCGSYEDALIAKKANCDRIELNLDLSLGGLTPPMGTVKKTLELEIPTVVMIRNRPGGFCYSKEIYTSMLWDLKEFMTLPIEGVAFGFLEENGKIDENRTREFVDIIHGAGKKAVFHRAFDNCQSIDEIKLLVDIGVDRLLTSGRKNKAMEGLDNLKRLQDFPLDIIVASGVNQENAPRIYEKTGITQYHASCRTSVIDPTTSVHADFNISSNDEFFQMDFKKAKEFVRIIHELQ